MDSKPAFAEESRSTEAVKIEIYWKYFHAGAGYVSLLLFVIIFLISQVLFIGTDYWLTLWTDAEELRYLRSSNLTETNATEDYLTDMNMTESSWPDFNITESSLLNFFTDESNLTDLNITDGTVVSDWIENIDTTTGVYVYSIMIGGLFFFIMIRTTYFYLICMSASVKLHNKMFKSIIRAQLAFFDQNPVGKYLN